MESKETQENIYETFYHGHWKLKFVWKHKSYLDPQIKITAQLILL